MKKKTVSKNAIPPPQAILKSKIQQNKPINVIKKKSQIPVDLQTNSFINEDPETDYLSKNLEEDIVEEQEQ